MSLVLTRGTRWIRDGDRVLVSHEELLVRLELEGEAAILWSLLNTSSDAEIAIERLGEIAGIEPTEATRCARELTRRLQEVGLLEAGLCRT